MYLYLFNDLLDGGGRGGGRRGGYQNYRGRDRGRDRGSRPPPSTEEFREPSPGW